MKKLFVLFFLFILAYLLSPWVSTGNTAFFQGIKSFDLILVQGIYLVMMFIYRYRVDGNVRFMLSRVDVLVLLYSCYQTVLIALSWECLDREVLLMHVACGLLYVTVRNSSREHIRVILGIFPFLLLWQLCYGIVKQTNCFYPGMGMSLVSGSLGNTGLWCCFVACVAVLSCGQIGMYRSKWIKGVLVMGVILSLGLLYVGNSRSAWLGFTVGNGYLLYQYTKQSCRLSCWVWSVALIVVLLLAGWSTRNKGESASGRLLIWKITGQMLVEKPFGRGINGFQKDYMDYQRRYFEQGGTSAEKRLADENRYAFNDFLRVFVEQGVQGGVLLLILMYFLFKKKKFEAPRDALTQALKGVALAWFVFSLFSYPGSQLQLRGMIVIIVALLSSSREQVWSFDGKWLIIFEVVLYGWLYASELCSYHRATRVWQECWKQQEIPVEYPHTKLLSLMNTPRVLPNCALLLNKQGCLEMAEEVARRGMQLYNSYGCYIEWGIVQEKQGKLCLAEEAWQRARYLIPNRFKPIYLQMMMWEKAGNRERAMVLANKLLNKEIKVLSPELYSYLGSAKHIMSN